MVTTYQPCVHPKFVITIVTNDDPFCNNGYRWYVDLGGKYLAKYKEEMMFTTDFWY
jgi:hypothetical protein